MDGPWAQRLFSHVRTRPNGSRLPGFHVPVKASLASRRALMIDPDGPMATGLVASPAGPGEDIPLCGPQALTRVVGLRYRYGPQPVYLRGMAAEPRWDAGRGLPLFAGHARRAEAPIEGSGGRHPCPRPSRHGICCRGAASREDLAGHRR